MVEERECDDFLLLVPIARNYWFWRQPFQMFTQHHRLISLALTNILTILMPLFYIS